MSDSINTFVTSSSLDSLGDLSFDDSLLDFDFDFSDELAFGNNSPVSEGKSFKGRYAPNVHFPLYLFFCYDTVPILLEESILELFEEMPELLELSTKAHPVSDSPLTVTTSEEEPKTNHKPAKCGVAKLKKKPGKNNATLTKKGVTSKQVQLRAQPPAPLIPPPTMDKGDALVFFPHSFVRLMNIGDISGLSKLLLSHADATCEFNFKGHGLLLRDFLDLSELFSELHPDTVNCVHTTKVMGNTVQAKLFSKFTDSDTIFQSVAVSKAKTPLFQRIFGDVRNVNRLGRWKKKIDALTNKADEEKAQLIVVAGAPGDMVIYANYYMKLTFDDVTRKMTRIDYEFELSSLTLVDPPKTRR